MNFTTCMDKVKKGVVSTNTCMHEQKFLSKYYFNPIFPFGIINKDLGGNMKQNATANLVEKEVATR